MIDDTKSYKGINIDPTLYYKEYSKKGGEMTGLIKVKCEYCKEIREYRPGEMIYRHNRYKFCSYNCRAKWRKEHPFARPNNSIDMAVQLLDINLIDDDGSPVEIIKNDDYDLCSEEEVRDIKKKFGKIFKLGDSVYIKDKNDLDYLERGIIGEIVERDDVILCRLDLQDNRSIYIAEEALEKQSKIGKDLQKHVDLTITED